MFEVNEFNRMQMALDDSGITESCDACDKLILNWNTVGDAATLAPDGVRILCKCCLTGEQPK